MSVHLQTVLGAGQGLAKDRPDMVSILSSVLGVSCRDDCPKLTLTSIALLVTSQPHVVVWNIMSHVEISSILDILDPDHGTFLLEDESLVGSSMEMEHNK